MGQGIALAVLGAAGLNGENLLQLLSDSGLAYRSLLLLDEESQLGRKVAVGERLLPLQSYAQADFRDIDLALACEPLSTDLMALIKEQGATLVAPQSALDEQDPLVAEINLERLALRKGDLLVVPSSEVTLLVRLLAPVYDELGLVAVHAHWNRSVSLQGRGAVEALASETAHLLNGKRPQSGIFSQPMAFNLLALHGSESEQEFTHLWERLWGDNRLILSINTVLAPIFFGDIVSICLETEQPSSVEELSDLFDGIEDLIWAEATADISVSARDAQKSMQICLAPLRQLDREGRRFGLLMAVDTARSGLARNLLKIAENLVKNLFVSYS